MNLHSNKISIVMHVRKYESIYLTSHNWLNLHENLHVILLWHLYFLKRSLIECDWLIDSQIGNGAHPTNEMVMVVDSTLVYNDNNNAIHTNTSHVDCGMNPTWKSHQALSFIQSLLSLLILLSSLIRPSLALLFSRLQLLAIEVQAFLERNPIEKDILLCQLRKCKFMIFLRKNVLSKYWPKDYNLFVVTSIIVKW